MVRDLRPLFDPKSGLDDPSSTLSTAPESMERMFQDSALLRMFMAFASSRFAEENILFLRDLRDWESRIALGRRDAHTARFLVNEYIRDSAPMELNISDKTRSDVMERVRASGGAASPSNFALAEREVFNALRDHVWPQFVRYQALKMDSLGRDSIADSLASAHRHRVVVVGGGFCGAFAALELDRDPRFEVVLVDTKEYFEYTASILRAFVQPSTHSSITVPHSAIVQNGRVILGEVRAVRSDCVTVNATPITFDSLVIATGSHYPSMIKSSNVTLAFRSKAVQQRYNEIREARHIVIVGGGFVGVELASEIADAFGSSGKVVTLIHSHARLLHRVPAMEGKDPHAMAMKHLEAAGVKLHLGHRAESWDEAASSVVLSDGSRVHADKVFWCGGPTPLTGFMRAHMAGSLDSRGYVKVDTTLAVESHRHIFAGGDITTIEIPSVTVQPVEQGESPSSATLCTATGCAPRIQQLDKSSASIVSASLAHSHGASAGSTQLATPPTGQLSYRAIAAGEASSPATSSPSRSAMGDAASEAAAATAMVAAGGTAPKGAKFRTLPEQGSGLIDATSADQWSLEADTGYVSEEKMAINAIEHGLLIATNIRNRFEGLPMVHRRIRRDICDMAISLGTIKGITVRDAVPSYGDAAALKRKAEEMVLACLRSRAPASSLHLWQV